MTKENDMKPTKEQIIEWTTLTYELGGHRLDQNEVRQALESDPETLEAAIELIAIATASVYAKGQEDMRERCLDICDGIGENNSWSDANDAAHAIRTLPIQKGGGN